MVYREDRIENNDRLTDAADIADLEMQRALDRSLESHKARKRLIPTGKCLYCEEQVKGELLFCDIDCRDDYQKYVER